MISLSHLSVGEKAKIIDFKTSESTFFRFAEMGLRLNDFVEIIAKLPLGGNLVVLSKYGKYILREAEARQIQTQRVAVSP